MIGQSTIRPTVSVIVPVYNSEKFIRRCIDALLEQTYERSGYEIILVDNNSSDRSRELAREYRDVRLISEPRQGSYAARNRGVSVSSGEILAFTDADCIVSPSWLAHMVTPFSSQEVCIVQGSRKFGRESKMLSILANYEAARAAFTFSPPGKGSHYGYTNNMAVRRGVFERCGPFKTIWRGADSLFVDRVINCFSHNAVRYVPDAAIQHLEMTRVWNWWRKKTIYGRSYELTVALRQSYPRLTWYQRKEIIRRAIQSGGYRGLQVILLIFLAGVGATAFQLGRRAGACDLRLQRMRQRMSTDSIS